MSKIYFTVAEAVAEIEDWSDSESVDIAILPPDQVDALTDNEQNDDDDFSNADSDFLPKDVTGRVEVTRKNLEQENYSAEDEEPLINLVRAENKVQEPRWRNSCNSYLREPINNETVDTKILSLKLEEKSPVELFEEFVDSNILNLIVDQSNLYSSQKNSDFQLDIPTLKRFLGILIFSGYNSAPNEKMFWSTSPDINFPIVRSSMSRFDYLKVKSALHLANNDNIDSTDKLYKVRKFLETVSNNCGKFGVFWHSLSIDESMWPYHGRHGCKMFIKGNPIRFGYKLWSLCSSNGYVFKFIPYTGKNDAFDPSLGLGESVVFELLSIVDHHPVQHKVYFDNFFTSHKLMVKLRLKKIFATGTVRENRTSKCPMSSDFKKSDRGHYEVKYDQQNKVLVVRWNDNAVVNMMSNFEDIYPTSWAERYSRKEKKVVKLPCPKIVGSYNKYMGGVDLFDRFMSNYRIKIKGKKWWWPYFANCIDLAVSNAWHIYKKVMNISMTQLEFRRNVAISLMSTPMEKKRMPNGHGHQPQMNIYKDLRLANVKHDLGKNEGNGRRRCRLCNSQTVYNCETCSSLGTLVALHPKCFSEYHK